MALSIILYLAAGAVAGLLGGTLGIGGGLIIVPMLGAVFAWRHIPTELIQLLALGTSMASIIFTSLSSFRAHNAHGAVLWRLVRRITPGLIVGTFLGTRLAAVIPPGLLKGIFAVFLCFVCIQMFITVKPTPERQPDGMAAVMGMGLGIGLISGLVGIGGGTITVPLLLWRGVSIFQAIGTSSAIGFPIAMVGALGYIVNGWNDALLPQYSLGYVYLPALCCVVAASVILAPIGVRLGRRLPIAYVRRVFSILLLIIALRMLWSILL